MIEALHHGCTSLDRFKICSSSTRCSISIHKRKKIRKKSILALKVFVILWAKGSLEKQYKNQVNSPVPAILMKSCLTLIFTLSLLHYPPTTFPCNNNLIFLPMSSYYQWILPISFTAFYYNTSSSLYFFGPSFRQ